MKSLKNIILVLLLAALCLLSISCQTVSGLGRDITWTAEATSDAIEGM